MKCILNSLSRAKEGNCDRDGSLKMTKSKVTLICSSACQTECS